MESEIDVLARTIFGEARGEYGRPDGGLPSLISVGNVVINRQRLGGSFGSTIQEVCQKPYQFSCWNRNDPNREQLMMVSREEQKCMDVARGVLIHQWPDLTKGSTHYYADWLTPPPQWARRVKAKIKIGQHLFFALKH